MEKKNKPTPSERVLGSHAVRHQMTSSVKSLTQLVASSIGAHKQGDTPLGFIVATEQMWIRSGMDVVAKSLGLNRTDFYTRFDECLNIMVGVLQTLEGRKSIAQAIKLHASMALKGDIGYPLEMTHVKSHQVLRDVVNDRKGEAVYRNFIALPGMFPIHCSCCYTSGQFGIMQNLMSVKGRQSMTQAGIADVVGKNISDRHAALQKYVTGTVKAVTEMSESDAFLLARALDVESEPTMGVLLISFRFSKQGGTYFEIRSACAMCLYSLDNPRIAAGVAHSVKWLADVRYALANMSPGKIRKDFEALRVKLDEDKRKAAAHLKETQRINQVSGISGEGVIQQSRAFSPANEIKLCERLIDSGFADCVIQGRKKTDTPRLKKPYNLKSLHRKLDLLNIQVDMKEEDLWGEEE